MREMFSTLSKNLGLIISRTSVAFRQELISLVALIRPNLAQLLGKLKTFLTAAIFSFMQAILLMMLLVASLLVWVFLVSFKAYQAAEKRLKTCI